MIVMTLAKQWLSSSEFLKISKKEGIKHGTKYESVAFEKYKAYRKENNDSIDVIK